MSTGTYLLLGCLGPLVLLFIFISCSNHHRVALFAFLAFSLTLALQLPSPKGIPYLPHLGWLVGWYLCQCMLTQLCLQNCIIYSFGSSLLWDFIWLRYVITFSLPVLKLSKGATNPSYKWRIQFKDDLLDAQNGMLLKNWTYFPLAFFIVWNFIPLILEGLTSSITGTFHASSLCQKQHLLTLSVIILYSPSGPYPIHKLLYVRIGALIGSWGMVLGILM